MSAAFAAFATTCPERIVIPVERRRANALNVEIGRPLARCKLRPPTEWGGRDMGARWLLSGGHPLIFDPCSATECPRQQEQTP